MGLLWKPVHGLHVGGVVEMDPVVCPVAPGSRSVSVSLGRRNVMQKDNVVAIVVVGNLGFVCIGFIRVDKETGLVDAECFLGPFVVCIHVVESGLEEGSVAAFLVEHDNAATLNHADLDFFAFRGVMSVGFGR